MSVAGIGAEQDHPRECTGGCTSRGRLMRAVLLVLSAVTLALTSIGPALATEVTLAPSGPGLQTELYQRGADANWRACVSSDGDATYVLNGFDYYMGYTTDLYELVDPVSPTGTIFSVTVFIEAEAAYSEVRFDSAYPVIHLGGITVKGKPVRLTGYYATYSQVFARPGGGSWSWEDVRNLQAGVALADPYKGPYRYPESRCTRLWVVVASNAEPTITSNGGGATAALQVAEHTTRVTTVTATDPDAGQTLSFSISGGADAGAGAFSIDPISGELSFVDAPDVESPADADGDNVYEVLVRASDDFSPAGTDTQMISVEVLDADEPPALPGPDRWTDISDAQWLASYGFTAGQVDIVADGRADGTFGPHVPVTRAQFAKMSVEAFALEKLFPEVPSFSDVGSGHFAFGWVEGARGEGLMNGYPDGTFGPGASMSRQQANTVLGRYLMAREVAAYGHIRGDSGTYGSVEDWLAAEGGSFLAPFTDASDLSPAHSPYTAYLVYRGVVHGSASDAGAQLCPSADLVRAQAAVLILRANGI